VFDNEKLSGDGNEYFPISLSNRMKAHTQTYVNVRRKRSPSVLIISKVFFKIILFKRNYQNKYDVDFVNTFHLIEFITTLLFVEVYIFVC